jgi:chromosome segregation ATPase
LSKKSVTADERIREANAKRKTAEQAQKAAEDKLTEIDRQAAAAKKNAPSITEHLSLFNKFMAALKRAPKRLMAVIEDILRNPPEQQQPQPTPERKRAAGIEI